VRLGKRPLPFISRDDRGVEALGDRAERVARARAPDAAARENHRRTGSSEEVGCAIDRVRGRVRRRGRLSVPDRRLGRPAREYIFGIPTRTGPCGCSRATRIASATAGTAPAGESTRTFSLTTVSYVSGGVSWILSPPRTSLFGLDREVEERDAVVQGVFQPVHRVHIAGAGDDDRRRHRSGIARPSVSPRLMSHGRLVARDDKPGVALAERPIQRERLLAGDPEGDVDPAVEHAVDDRLGDGRSVDRARIRTALGLVRVHTARSTDRVLKPSTLERRFRRSRRGGCHSATFVSRTRIPLRARWRICRWANSSSLDPRVARTYTSAEPVGRMVRPAR